VKQLNDMGVNVMVSVWAQVENGSSNVDTMRQNQYMVSCPQNYDMCHQNDYLYDPTIPEAREYVWQQVKKGYYDYGIKIYWIDADEPEQNVGDPSQYYSIGNDKTVGMMYPNFHMQTFYNGLLDAGETEVVMLSRSTWAGGQRFGTIVWSGDIESTFDSLSQQVRAGLNMGLSGQLWWTTDIGGFYDGNINDPVFQELIVRWFQYGAFCPLFRIHGYRNPQDPTDPVCGFSGGPNEVWSFGDTAYQAIVVMMNIRESIRPYIMQQMQLASQYGTPVMRPLWFDFPDDKQLVDIDDQFMFGPTYLVAPVLEYGATSRRVYFPAGATWKHYFTNTTVVGGVYVDAFPAPLAQFPLFVRL